MLSLFHVSDVRRRSQQSRRTNFLFACATVASIAALVSLAPVFSGCGGGSSRHVRGVLLVTGGARMDAAEPPTGSFNPVSSDLLPNAATALTGLVPPEHGVRVDGVGALPANAPTLAKACSRAGWDCAAFLCDPALSASHGLDAGFDVYSALITTNRSAGFGRTAAETCGAAADWLLSRGDMSRPVFLWVHVPELPEPSAPGESLRPLVDAFSGNGAKIAFAAIGPLPGRVQIPTAVPDWAKSGEGGGRPPLSALAASLAPDGSGLPSSEDQYWESVSPWYAMRLAPLGAERVADGLRSEPVAAPLGHQLEMRILAARGHLGEGLVPPLPPEVGPTSALDDAATSRIARWSAAVSMPPGSNRVEALRALSDDFPDVPLFHEALGDALSSARDWTGACNAYASAAKFGWNMVRANRMQARCHAMIGNVPAAIDRAEAAFMADQTDPLPRRELSDLLLRTGAALLSAGDLAEARGCLDRSLLLAPDNPGAAFERARLDLATGATNAAVAGLRELLRHHPSDKRARKLLEALK